MDDVNSIRHLAHGLSEVLCKGSINRFCRHSDRRDAGGHIFNYDRSRADHAGGANGQSLNDTCPCADMRSRVYMDAAGKNCPRANVRVSTYEAIVINDGTGIDYGIGANAASGLKNSPRHNLDSICNLHFRSDDRRGMYDARKAIPFMVKAIVNILATCRGTGGAQTIHQPHVGRCMKQYLSVAAETLDSEQWRGCWVQVNKSENIPAAPVEAY